MSKFGAFAKGLGGVVFGGEQGNESADQAVENLLQRVADGVLSEDRREALENLRDLMSESAKAQSAVGAMGFPILCEVVREEHKDVELLRTALECLANAFTAPAHGSGMQQQDAQVVAVNAELFSRDKQNVPMLLSLLEEPPAGVDDFHVRYHALQILMGLASSLHRLQEAVLAHPMGVIRLMDMMGEREVVRNEALLLMIVLTHSNAEVQKIAAFEGAFERLFTIIREEGAADGGIVVQDCLQLTHSLLRKNASNQRMFRELGFVAQLPALLRLQQRGGSIARQQAANLLCALETVRVLLAGDLGVILPAAPAVDAETAATQDAILKSGVVDILIGAPIGDHAISSTAVRIECLECLAALLAVSTSTRDKLLSAATSVRGQRIAALFALLQSALHRPTPQERLAAEAVLAAFCGGNPAGQAQLASTLLPSGKAGPSFGQELLAALLHGGSAGNGAAKAAAAARILSHLLAGCAQAKAQAMAAQVPPTGPPTQQPQQNGSSSPAPVPLLAACCAQASAALAARPVGTFAAAALQGLLVVWCHGCAPAATVMADQAALLQQLADLTATRAHPGDTLVAGLAAALLGVCMLAQSNGSGSSSSPQVLQPAAALLDAVAVVGGADQLLTALRDLQSSPTFQAAAAGPKPLPPVTRSLLASALAVDGGDRLAASTVEEPQLSPYLVAIIREALPLLEQQLPAAVANRGHASAAAPQQPAHRPAAPQAPQQLPPPWRPPSPHAAAAAVPGPGAASAPQPAELQQARATIDRLQGEVAQLRLQSAAAGQGPQQIQNSEQLAAAVARAAQAEAQVAALRERLDQTSAVVDGLRAELQAAREQAEAARGAAAKADADMEDLANAFQGLESHAVQMEAELRDARAQPPAQQPGVTQPPGQAEMQRQIDAAVEAARADAEAEAEENLNDLLACLGQEERKTECLAARLRELGEDVDVLLEGVLAEDEENNESETEGPDLT